MLPEDPAGKPAFPLEQNSWSDRDLANAKRRERLAGQAEQLEHHERLVAELPDLAMTGRHLIWSHFVRWCWRAFANTFNPFSRVHHLDPSETDGLVWRKVAGDVHRLLNHLGIEAFVNDLPLADHDPELAGVVRVTYAGQRFEVEPDDLWRDSPQAVADYAARIELGGLYLADTLFRPGSPEEFFGQRTHRPAPDWWDHAHVWFSATQVDNWRLRPTGFVLICEPYDHVSPDQIRADLLARGLPVDPVIGPGVWNPGRTLLVALRPNDLTRKLRSVAKPDPKPGPFNPDPDSDWGRLLALPRGVTGKLATELQSRGQVPTPRNAVQLLEQLESRA